MLQTRGNGTLALDDAELSFVMWLPRREFHIPLSSIESVGTTWAHLGKFIGMPLLKVVFRTEAGRLDSIAWAVRNLSEIKRSLEYAVAQRGS